jgi:hypothetical protein
LFALGCSETVSPEVTTDPCEAIEETWTLGWWLAVLWPAALFVGSLFVRRAREHMVIAGALIAGLAVAFWVPLLLHVTSNL